MPHSLRAKLSGLRYKGILEDKDYKRLCKALDNENVLERIQSDISKQSRVHMDGSLYIETSECVQIINKYKAERW